MKIKISTAARIDLEEIWLYTFKRWSKEQADRYYELILSEIEFISKNTDCGKSYEFVKIGYRASIVKSHLVFYRVIEEEEVEIIRILHQNMDVENILNS